MTHSTHCIPSEGDWLCAGGCTHDADEADEAQQLRHIGECIAEQTKTNQAIADLGRQMLLLAAAGHDAAGQLELLAAQLEVLAKSKESV